MKKKKSLFYKIYFSVLIVFFALLAAFLVYLSAFIKDYDKGLARTVSKSFFEDVFLGKDIEKIIEMSEIVPNEFETMDDLKHFIATKLDGELSYTGISHSQGTSDMKYAVKNGEVPVFIFDLYADQKNDYHPKSIEMKNADITYTVKALNSTKITLNGVELRDDYITQRQPLFEAIELPEGVPMPYLVTYTVDGLSRHPLASATNRNGLPVLLVLKDGVYTEEPIYDTQQEELCEYLLLAAKQYAKCMQNDASKASALKYYEKGTEIYDFIRTCETGFAWDHNGYDFEDVTMSEFFRIDDSTVSLRISFTHVLKLYGKQDYKDVVDITFFAREVDGKYLIFAQRNNL